MPLGVRPVCFTCKTTVSTMWRKGPQEEVLCNSCGLKQIGGATVGVKVEAPTEIITGKNGGGNTNNNSSTNQVVERVRKSSRIKPSRHKSTGANKSMATKGKSRRIIFKKNPIKATMSVSTVVTSENVFYKGQYYQIGDLVSLMDHDGGIYYAQLRGFLQDQFNEKSAVITWLLPTQQSVKGTFDPATYILGPEEDLPRKLECMEFVCHAPSDYYKSRNAPYLTSSLRTDLAYIWTNIGPQIINTPTTDEIFGSREEMGDIKLE